ncbi:MAG: hypothetical protein KDA22_15950 [Phycisphaerales bacterium]|nr:hypothetical protein [Phycisphaerales bacterium]
MFIRPFVVVLSAVACPMVQADVVFQNLNDNGIFTPFNTSNAGVVKYGDSGWLTASGSPPVELAKITMSLAVFDSPTPGTTDLVFTFNDGDPSGLVFGSGDELYSTVIRGVELPATAPGDAAFLTVEIPLPGVQTLGNFNDVGWSVQTQNWNYAGSFGFEVSTTFGQVVGFYTNNASFFDGRNGWSLFSFGPDPVTGVANFVVTIESAVPCAADLDGNGIVDGADLGELLAQWGTAGPSGDLNGDGTVDGADLGLLLAAWGTC